MICISDAIRGLWYILGNYVVTAFWPGIYEDRDRAVAQLVDQKIKSQSLVDIYETIISDLQDEMTRMDNRHLEDYADLQVVCNGLRDQLPKPKVVKPVKKSTPIKPRARKTK